MTSETATSTHASSISTSLVGKRAVVCGSTQGIGRACAEEMAAAGGEIVLIARHEGGLQQVADGLDTSHGQSHAFLVADFADWEQLRDRVRTELYGKPPVHILINNTGGPPAGRAIEAQPEEYLDAFVKHLVCNQTLLQAVVMGMKSEGYGRVINIISTSVIAPIPGLGVSNTIRGAVANWGRTLAEELGPLGITVNNVLPGFTETSRLQTLLQGRADRAGSTLADVQENLRASIPARRLAAPQELGKLVAFLASPAGGYINGVNLPIDGGRTATQ